MTLVLFLLIYLLYYLAKHQQRHGQYKVNVLYRENGYKTLKVYFTKQQAVAP